MIDVQRIVVLAPHTDDGEFGCGGVISRWVEENKHVYYVAFSSAEQSVPDGFPKDILKKEVRDATTVLGIPHENLTLFDYPVRKFPAYRQEILDDMIRLRDQIRPDLVLLPSSADTHQDHQVISQEGFRAFKTISVIGYEMPHNIRVFDTTLFVAINEEHLRRKMDSLKCYESQQDRSYAAHEFLKGLAKVRGVQVNAEYAEAFEVVRCVIK